jgi:hypothetical protein
MVSRCLVVQFDRRAPWHANYTILLGVTVRVYRGNQCHRVAMRMMLLKEVFDLPVSDLRVQAGVRTFIRHARLITGCESTGMYWSAVVSCTAPGVLNASSNF